MPRLNREKVEQALEGIKIAEGYLQALLAQSDLFSDQPSEKSEKVSTSDSLPNPLPSMAWGKKFSQASRKFMIQTAKDFGIDSIDSLPTCIAFETAKTFRPSVKNPHSSGTGAIQFMEFTCQEMTRYFKKEFDHSKLVSMTMEEQLVWAWYYFKMVMEQRKVKRLGSLTDVYMAIHWPAAIGLPEDATMYAKGSKAYGVNTVLDRNKDGVITKREAGALVAAVLEEGMKEENFG